MSDDEAPKTAYELMLERLKQKDRAEGVSERALSEEMPVAWKKVYGKGRIFYSSLGHTADVFDIPEAITIVKCGMLWASESRYEPTPNLVSPVYPRR